MPDPASLRSLLAAVLASRGVDVSALSIPLSNEALGRVWGAFCAFAAEPVQDLYPNLTVPGPGRSDTDRLSFQFTPERPATRNSGPRPPSAWLSREVYLVDVDGEWLRSDDAALRLDLDRRLPDRAATPCTPQAVPTPRRRGHGRSRGRHSGRTSPPAACSAWNSSDAAHRRRAYDGVSNESCPPNGHQRGGAGPDRRRLRRARSAHLTPSRRPPRPVRDGR
jgi:hypothetical protein